MDLSQIGWPDPFNNEEIINQITWKEPIDYDDLVCNPKNLIKGKRPRMYWIPNKELMFKIMRACIEIDSKDQLWFHK